MGIAADAFVCGLLWTYSYENAKSHFSVDLHRNRSAGIHVTRTLGDLRYYRRARFHGAVELCASVGL